MQDLMFADEPVEKREQLLRVTTATKLLSVATHASLNSTK